jgi:hypothetical protein
LRPRRFVLTKSRFGATAKLPKVLGKKPHKNLDTRPWAGIIFHWSLGTKLRMGESMRNVLFVLVSICATTTWAGGLVIHGVEVGIGKFHRYDNKMHRYDANSAWKPYVLPDSQGDKTPLVFNNSDGSVSIQFSNLKELLQTIVHVSQQKNLKVSVLSMEAHGMPGGMWFPKDARQKNAKECADWRNTTGAEDKVNYDGYYTETSKEEIMELREASLTPASYECMAGAPEWKEIVGKVPGIKAAFAENAQINLLSCLVGLGPVGEAFTNTLASLLLTGNRAFVRSTINLGLGDWSIPEGMGFWDYQNDQQLAQDNKVYPVNRKDRDIMQKGVVRITTLKRGRWVSNLVANQDFILFNNTQAVLSNTPERIFRGVHQPVLSPTDFKAPKAIHIPGTSVLATRVN